MPKRKVTEKMRKANQQNAQKSTGPKTPEGKQRSAKNSIRHGLLAKPVFIEDNENEDPVEFESLLTALYHDYNPQGGHEVILVQRIAASYWRLRRACQFETQSIQNERNENPDTNAILPNPQQLDLLIRYEGLIDRELNRVMTQLQRLQTQRREREQQEAEAEGQTEAKELFHRLLANNVTGLPGGPRRAEAKGEGGFPDPMSLISTIQANLASAAPKTEPAPNEPVKPHSAIRNPKYAMDITKQTRAQREPHTAPPRPLAKSPPHNNAAQPNEPVEPTPHSEFRTPHSNAPWSPVSSPCAPGFKSPSPLK